jgi:hypothetical protein
MKNGLLVSGLRFLVVLSESLSPQIGNRTLKSNNRNEGDL